MSPQEKAEQLTRKIRIEIPYYRFSKTKQLAKMMVDEIMDASDLNESEICKWEEVKREIENL